MDELFYKIMGLVGFTHPVHPVLITMVVGPAIASFIFVAIAFFLKKPELYKTGRQLTVVAFVFWFPTVAVGIIDWFHFYGGSPKMIEIVIKLVLAGFLFLVLLGNIMLFKAGQKKPLIPLVFTLAATIIVSAIGFFGGEIVFGGSSKAESAPTAAGTVTQTADGFKQYAKDGFTLDWRIHDTSIDVRVSYATNGWVGVGFGKTGTMEGSHIILGFVVDGKATVADHFGYAHDRHGPEAKVGGKDSLTARGGTFANGVTTITFTMPLNTGNPKDPVLVGGESYKILLANGGDGAQDLETYHGRSGRMVVDLTL